jgi:hypothetical protein
MGYGILVWNYDLDKLDIKRETNSETAVSLLLAHPVYNLITVPIVKNTLKCQDI